MSTWTVVFITLSASAFYFTLGTLLKRHGKGLFVNVKDNRPLDNAIMAVMWGAAGIALTVAILI